MADDDWRQPKKPRKRRVLSEAERPAAIARLVLIRRKLTESEADELREVYPEIFDAHIDAADNLLRRRGLGDAMRVDLLHDTFVKTFASILDVGFPEDLGAWFYSVAKGKLLNFLRDTKADPVSLGLPSSGSEKPPSSPLDIDRAVVFRELAQRILPRMTPGHRAMFQVVVLGGLTHPEAAEVLGLEIGTVKSRVMAAKNEFIALARELHPPSGEMEA